MKKSEHNQSSTSKKVMQAVNYIYTGKKPTIYSRFDYTDLFSKIFKILQDLHLLEFFTVSND